MPASTVIYGSKKVVLHPPSLLLLGCLSATSPRLVRTHSIPKTTPECTCVSACVCLPVSLCVCVSTHVCFRVSVITYACVPSYFPVSVPADSSQEHSSREGVCLGCRRRRLQAVAAPLGLADELRLCALEQRFCVLEQRLWAVERRLRALEQRLWALEQRLWALERRLWALEQRSWALEHRLCALEQRP